MYLETPWTEKANSGLQKQGQIDVPKDRHWTCRLWFVKELLLTRTTLCTCLPGEKQEVADFSVVNDSSA